MPSYNVYGFKLDKDEGGTVEDFIEQMKRDFEQSGVGEFVYSKDTHSLVGMESCVMWAMKKDATMIIIGVNDGE